MMISITELRKIYQMGSIEVRALDGIDLEVDAELAGRLVKFAHMTRNLKGQGLDEGASTRLLVHAAKLIASGVDPVVACRSCIAQALSDDPEMLSAINELSASLF